MVQHGRKLARSRCLALIRLTSSAVQVNVVVMRGANDDELCDFVEMTRDAPINVRFIEWMPFDGNVWRNSKMVSFKEMQARVCSQFPELHRCQVRTIHSGNPHDSVLSRPPKWLKTPCSMLVCLQHVMLPC